MEATMPQPSPPAKASASRPLTPKQTRFVEQYLICHDATKAAIAAGYSPNSAGWIGYQLLQKTTINREITVRQQTIAERAGIKAENVLKEIAAVGFGEAKSKLKHQDKLAALDKLARHLGLFNADKSGGAGGGVTVNINFGLPAAAGDAPIDAEFEIEGG